ncbi:hypothetical protein EJ04DRAFT_476507, partial [Polyplosphaeria fusca]
MAVKKRPKTLSYGRPPTTKPSEHMSSKQSRAIIRTHHRLEKQKAAAERTHDSETASKLSLAIAQNGGLKTYQAASKQGQSTLRGGDSSQLLVTWLLDLHILAPQTPAPNPLRVLEIGALSTKNAISRFPPSVLHVTRIDLHSQAPGITQQDFMQRPLPTSSDEAFNILSLSLVLNYVPTPASRGAMLQRTRHFLLPGGLLFLVLPLACVQNSRYLDEEGLVGMMGGLGYGVVRSKVAKKLVYYLF